MVKALAFAVLRPTACAVDSATIWPVVSTAIWTVVKALTLAVLSPAICAVVRAVTCAVVKADTKKEGKVKGTVVELFEDEGKVLIKTDKGKTLKILADKITSVEEAPAKSVPSKKKSKK